MKNLKRFQDSRSLPIGHVERKAAEVALREEYKNCHRGSEDRYGDAGKQLAA